MNHVTEIMKGVHLNGQGGFEKLKYREDIPIPKLDHEDEVLIKVYASYAARHGERNVRSSRQGRRGFIPSARSAEGAEASLCLKL